MWMCSWSLFEVLSRNLLGGSEETHETYCRIASLRHEVLTRVSTEYFACDFWALDSDV
jgi:hypothetical protein